LSKIRVSSIISRVSKQIESFASLYEISSGLYALNSVFGDEVNITVGCGSYNRYHDKIRIQGKLDVRRYLPKKLRAYLAESTICLFVQGSEPQHTYMTCPMITFRHRPVLDGFGTDPTNIVVVGVLNKRRNWGVYGHMF